MKETGDVVMTPYGEYRLCEFEIHSFMSVYGKDWIDEICLYADSLMESQWLAG